VFACQFDLDLHLERFGNVAHLQLWECVHLLLEEDGFEAGVDNHGEGGRRGSRAYRDRVRACRDLLSGDGNG